jgi:TonB family protein
MSQNPWLRPKSVDATPSDDPKPADGATTFLSGSELKNVTQVAETLAAHGGGALSSELALDLVLNSLVEQARDVSAATGAAIALIRDGEMVCRATTGTNAPDLGVRVETGSGIAGDCLRSEQIQLCHDTETDSRVNAENCRRLGVRSMLVAPLTDAGAIFGILQLFSPWPNVFGEREIAALQSLVARIAESRREAQAAVSAASLVHSDAASPLAQEAVVAAAGANDQRVSFESDFITAHEAKNFWENGVWSAALMVLVVAAAVLLGLIVGWRGAIKGGSASASLTSPVSRSEGATPAESAPSVSPNPLAATPGQQAPFSASAAKSPATTAQPPTGGLIVTENGKVIYRTLPSGPTGPLRSNSAPDGSGTRLIHRVQPEYPPEARARNLQGSVVLNIQIHGDGTVGEVDVASGNPILADAAVEAVRQWRYKANFANGHPVESQTRITVNFILPPG